MPNSIEAGPRKCEACGDSLVFFPSEGGSEIDGKGIHQCIHPDCELNGMSQPVNDGQSIAAFGRDGSVTLIQKGPTSQGEGNLPQVCKRISKRLPERYTIDLARGPEFGVDLIVRCKYCKAEREIQVTRAVDSEFAQNARHSNVAWTISKPADIIERIRNILEKKTNKHSDRGSQILVIDAAIDEMWTPIFYDLEEMRSLLSGCGWYSLVLVGPSGVIRVDGEDMDQWCVCHGSMRTS